jgi:ATP-dependent Clp protease adaptor protein ClpS
MPNPRRPVRGRGERLPPMASRVDEFLVGLFPAPTKALSKAAPQEVEDRTTRGGEGSQVFLFNCECHTFEEVISQLLKAVPGMTRPLAEELAWRVHTTGLAEVYRGGASDCDRVARILGETGLIVQVM